MANISTIKVGSTTYGITATPTAHASTATTYGAATASKYGHVKLSDSYKSSGGAAASGIGASSAAVYNAYNTLNSKFVVLSYTTGSSASSGVVAHSTYTVSNYPATSYCIIGGAIQLHTGSTQPWFSLTMESYTGERTEYSCGYVDTTTIRVCYGFPYGNNRPVKIILYKYA